MKAKVQPKHKAATLLIAFVVWEIASVAAGSKYFPHSWVVLPDLLSLLLTFTFWKELVITVWLSSLAFVIGAVIATVIGIAVALKRSGEIATQGVLNFLRSIPSVVFLPLLIASIGSSARTAVILAAFVVIFKLVTYIIRGIKQTEKSLIDSAEIMGLSMPSKIMLLYLPSTISIAGTGLRLSASRAFGTVIAAGIVAGTPGLGSALLMAEANANYPRVFSYVVVMGIAGAAIYAGFTQLEKKLVLWRVSV